MLQGIWKREQLPGTGAVGEDQGPSTSKGELDPGGEEKAFLLGTQDAAQTQCIQRASALLRKGFSDKFTEGGGQWEKGESTVMFPV